MLFVCVSWLNSLFTETIAIMNLLSNVVMIFVNFLCCCGFNLLCVVLVKEVKEKKHGKVHANLMVIIYSVIVILIVFS